MKRLEDLRERILACRRCPRLVQWREDVAANPPRRYRGQTYHARALPGFGDPKAELMIVGLAPAAHGANRTGRMFTGDRSGDWLYRALRRAGFANQAQCESLKDGLALTGAYVTAVGRCAPPQNKLLREEIENCWPFLAEEFEIMWPRLRVIAVLGSIAFKGTLAVLKQRGLAIPRPQPRFGHGTVVDLGPDAPALIMSYHPSQQNTFTGRLTETMFDEVWAKARALVDGPARPRAKASTSRGRSPSSDT